MQRYKILIVEDESDVLDLYKDILTSSGFEVLGARDGLEGIKVAKENYWDLVLLDIVMPHVDGLRVLEELRLKFPDKPILMISNLVNDSAISRAMGSGASGYVVKSELDPNQFLIEVKKHLGIL